MMEYPRHTHDYILSSIDYYWKWKSGSCFPAFSGGVLTVEGAVIPGAGWGEHSNSVHWFGHLSRCSQWSPDISLKKLINFYFVSA